MNDRRTITLGHATSLAFAAILLVASRNYLVQYPLISALLLTAFSPVYFIAGKISGKRYFLYPFLILLVLAYHLLLFAAGIPPGPLPVFSLVAIFLILAADKRNLYGEIEAAGRSVHHVNAFVTAFLSAVILLRISYFFREAPLIIAMTFFGFSAYWAVHFRDARKPFSLAASVVLAFAGFAFLLHSHGVIALVLTALLMIPLGYFLHFHKRLFPEAVFQALLLIAFLYQAFFGDSGWNVALGYGGMGLVTLQVAMLIHSSGRMKLLYPVFIAGMLMILVPVYFLYPYKVDVLVLFYLLIAFAGFLDTARHLRLNAKTFPGIVGSRIMGVAARVTFAVAFIYLIWNHFPGSYRLALLALGFSYLAATAAFRTPAAILKSRNLYIYIAALFFESAYLLAIRRFGLEGIAGTIAISSVVPLIAWFFAAWQFRKVLSSPQLLSVYDGGTIVALGGVLCQALLAPADLNSALIVAVLLAGTGIAFYLNHGILYILNIAPVAAALLIHVAAPKFGITGEWAGAAFLLLGFLAAFAGAREQRGQKEWFRLHYFEWFLFFAISLALFYPYAGAGAYLAPLWAVPLLIIAKHPANARTRANTFSIITELLGHTLVLIAACYLLTKGLYLPAAVALFIYAGLYTYLSRLTRQTSYFYPANFLLAAAFFVLMIHMNLWRLYLLYAIPLALIFYTVIVLLRRKNLNEWTAPVHAAAAANTLLGAFLMVLYSGSGPLTGVLTGALYLFCYAALIRLTSERAFFAGVALAASFIFYYLLWYLPFTTPGNHLAVFAPVSLIVAWIGRLLQDRRAGWSLYSAAILLALASGLFALSPALTATGLSRVVLLVSMSVWLLLLLWTQSEIFVYLASFTLATLAYNFLQSSTDRFGQHMFVFFLYGIALIGFVFLARVARNLVRYRKPILLVEGKKWSERFVYVTPVLVIVLATFGAFTIESTSNPQFCGMCHTMNNYYTNWQGSVHGKTEVSCASCHYEPGLQGYVKAKVRGFSELVTETTGTGAYRPQAVVNDSSCLRSGCHDVNQLAEAKPAKYNFDHTIHLGMEIEGIELHCTSCHSKVDQTTHFAVETQTCYSCHFAAQEVVSRSCTGCHEVPTQPVGARNFVHATVVSVNNDEQCQMCHASAMQTVSAPQISQCSECHLEQPASLMKTADVTGLHQIHVNEHSIKCARCHSDVTHGRKQQHPPRMTAECSGCHGQNHSEPALIYAGMGGVGVQPVPSPMYLSGVECTACHENGFAVKLELTLSASTCGKCHTEAVQQRAQEYGQTLASALLEIESLEDRVSNTLAAVPADRRTQFLKLLADSRKNIELVKKGNGIHNYHFARQLLEKSSEFLHHAESLSAPVLKTARLGG